MAYALAIVALAIVAVVMVALFWGAPQQSCVKIGDAFAIAGSC